jgi:hypothetical protein
MKPGISPQTKPESKGCIFRMITSGRPLFGKSIRIKNVDGKEFGKTKANTGFRAGAFTLLNLI